MTIHTRCEICDFSVDLVRCGLLLYNFEWIPFRYSYVRPSVIGIDIRRSIAWWIKAPKFPEDTVQSIKDASPLELRQYLQQYYRKCRFSAALSYSGFAVVAYIIESRIELAQSITFSQWKSDFMSTIVFGLASQLHSLSPWIQKNGGWKELKKLCDKCVSSLTRERTIAVRVILGCDKVASTDRGVTVKEVFF